MESELLEATRSPSQADSYPPYPPGVVDQFLAWVDRLPFPAWLCYLLLLAALIIFFNGLAWIDGSLRFPTFDLYRSSVPVYPVASLALIHYLNGVALRALADFRPVLGVGDAEYQQLAYKLVTLPRRGTRVTLALSLLFTAAYIYYTPYLVALFGSSPLVAIAESAVYAFTFGMIAVFIYHIMRQLRLVSLIHASATEINLFQRTPLYAFSKLTAQTGISLLLMNYFGVLTDPATFENIALFALTIAASLVALLCFILPLRGMHNQIVAEKNRLRAECSARLEATIEELFARADAQELAEVDGLHQLMASLGAICERIEKIPTWPWEPGTFMSFLTVFILPFVAELLLMIAGRFGLFDRLFP
ncbi:MAG: hypothetical protein ACK2UK_18365 [Candidatus Promineifilaceae bacterium]|jgi:hypothetical protein